MFLSYCQKDKGIADIIDTKLPRIERKIEITRDIRAVGYGESFSAFMQTIADKDFVISIVSDRYLKSRNCMYEVCELMRDRRFKEGKEKKFMRNVITKLDMAVLKAKIALMQKKEASDQLIVMFIIIAVAAGIAGLLYIFATGTLLPNFQTKLTNLINN